jgi:hypothetical protein
MRCCRREAAKLIVVNAPPLRRLLSVALVLAGATLVPRIAPAQVAGSVTAAGGAITPVPVFVYPGWGTGCGLYGNCFWAGSAARTYRERRDEVMRQREEIATPRLPPDLWSNGGQWGYARRLPPPTPESEIQPQFRDSGQILPQFRDSGTR